LSSVIHEKLTADPHYKQRANVLDWWDYDYDQLYSKKFTKSTAATYADIMEQINNRQFPQKAQEELEYVLGMLMERSEEHTSELQSRFDLVCRLLLEKKKEIRSIGKDTH